MAIRWLKANINKCSKKAETAYFLGGTWPTFTRTQMTLRVCIPMEQGTSPSLLGGTPTEVLKEEVEGSSVQGPQGPVCQW